MYPIKDVLYFIMFTCWTAVYIEATRIGIRDRTYAMPVVALALNFAWETTYGIFGLLYFRDRAQTWWTVMWILTDLGIIYTYFTYGRAEFPSFVTRRVFVAGSLLVFVIAFLLQAACLLEIYGPLGAINYSAFMQNALMSGSFIAMFVARGGSRGQSLTLAVCKCIGSLSPILCLGRTSIYVVLVGLVIVTLDVIYIGLLIYAKRGGRTLGTAGTHKAPKAMIS
jgi:hypothetical protein